MKIIWAGAIFLVLILVTKRTEGYGYGFMCGLKTIDLNATNAAQRRCRKEECPQKCLNHAMGWLDDSMVPVVKTDLLMESLLKSKVFDQEEAEIFAKGSIRAKCSETLEKNTDCEAQIKFYKCSMAAGCYVLAGAHQRIYGDRLKD